jgi:putative transposase
MILSLYSRGMTTRDIHAHLAEIYGVEVSPALVSAVTDVVTDEIAEWQNRPLDAFYAILYIDALVVKVRDGGAVDNKAAYLVTGVDADGFKHVLGIWLGTAEGSRFWAGVLAELRNRGIRDVLFVCCDGLTGLPEAIVATWPQAKVQTCVIHLIRSSMKYVSWKERKKAAAAMRPIYTALNEAAAKTALENLRRDFGKKSPGMVAAWERAWDNFVPFHRRGGSQASLPRDQEYHRAPHRRRRAGSRKRTAGHRNPGLESSHEFIRRRVPRPYPGLTRTPENIPSNITKGQRLPQLTEKD